MRVATSVFSTPVREWEDDVLAVLHEQAGGFEVDGETVAAGAASVAAASPLFASRSEVRRAISQGGVSVNGQPVTSLDGATPELLAGRYLIVQHGRKKLAVGRRSG